MSVFAWAEDVSLSVLTSENSALTPQSGEEVDEANAKGVVSGPATAVSRMAAYFVKMPYIGPFAMATAMAADTTASIARLFGYSRPVVTKAPEPYKPTTISSLALTNVPDVSQKLTVDHKQELTVDPRISGLGGMDPLNIREIAKRESYLTTFSWIVGSVPESLLFNARITPVIWNESGTAPNIAYHFPACAFAALPFRYWAGSMKFRFQVVCSAYHKGRLKIVYDPNFIGSNEYNVNYMRIVDIAEEKDFTIEIGNGQEGPLLSHHDPGPGSMTQTWSTTAFTGNEQGNGVLGVFIVNELTVPNTLTNNDIEINVFVSAGDDFEVFVPDDRFQNFTFFEPQSGEEENAPIQFQTDKVGPNGVVNSHLDTVYIGESISSFRTMLKRYSVWTCMCAGASNQIITGKLSRFPYYRGNYASAPDETSSEDPYAYCNTTLLHWVRLAFNGSRGSIRYKFIPRGMKGDEVFHMSAGLSHSPSGYEYIVNPILPETLISARKRIMYQGSTGSYPGGQAILGSTGACVTTGGINPTLEFEVPYYEKYRFEPGRIKQYTNPWYNPFFNYRVELGASPQEGSGVVDIHTATGEDFQVYFFLGLPKCYYEPLPPV